MLRKKVDNSMEMALTSSYSQSKNTGMVRIMLRRMFSHRVSVCNKINLKNTDGTEETINHKKCTKVTLPRASSDEDGNLRGRCCLRKPGHSKVQSAIFLCDIIVNHTF